MIVFRLVSFYLYKTSVHLVFLLKVFENYQQYTAGSLHLKLKVIIQEISIVNNMIHSYSTSIFLYIFFYPGTGLMVVKKLL